MYIYICNRQSRNYSYHNVYVYMNHNVTLFQNHRTDETLVFVFSASEPQDLMDKYKDKDVVDDLVRKKALWGSFRVNGVYIF